MALSANWWPFQLRILLSPLPPFHTDSHPCTRIGGPVDRIGGPIDLQKVDPKLLLVIPSSCWFQ